MKIAVLFVNTQIENAPRLILRYKVMFEVQENDKKLARALTKRLTATKLSGIVYALLILSLSLGISFIFYSTAIQMGGVFYAFLVFIPILLSFTLVAVYYRLKIAWRKSSALSMVIFLGIALFLLFIFLAYSLSV